VVGQHLDGDEVAGAHLHLGPQQLAEVAPVDRLVGGRNDVVVLRPGHHPGLGLGARDRGESRRQERRGGAAGGQRPLEESPSRALVVATICRPLCLASHRRLRALVLGTGYHPPAGGMLSDLLGNSEERSLVQDV